MTHEALTPVLLMIQVPPGVCIIPGVSKGSSAVMRNALFWVTGQLVVVIPFRPQRNNPKERCSQLLRSGSLISRIVLSCSQDPGVLGPRGRLRAADTSGTTASHPKRPKSLFSFCFELSSQFTYFLNFVCPYLVRLHVLSVYYECTVAGHITIQIKWTASSLIMAVLLSHCWPNCIEPHICYPCMTVALEVHHTEQCFSPVENKTEIKDNSHHWKGSWQCKRYRFNPPNRNFRCCKWQIHRFLTLFWESV